MKRFFAFVMEWKTAASFMFSGSIVIYGVVSFLLGEHTFPLSALLSLGIMSMCGTFLQLLAFSNHFFKKMRYTLRMLVFFVPFFLILAAVAHFFAWFPTESSFSWLIFSAIFLIAFIGATVSFEIYFHFMGKKYDGLLGQYRKDKENTK